MEYPVAPEIKDFPEMSMNQKYEQAVQILKKKYYIYVYYRVQLTLNMTSCHNYGMHVIIQLLKYSGDRIQ